MSADLERELRRLMADPPVGTGDIDAAGSVAALDRRVARVRARRRAGAALSLAVLLVAGMGGAATLSHQTAATTAAGGAGDSGGQLPASAPLAGTPPEVLIATQDALAQISGASVAGPVRWVTTPDGILIEVPLTGPATCRYCHDPGAPTGSDSGSVLEVQLPTTAYAAAGGNAPQTSAAPRATDAARLPQPTWSLRTQATDLARYGPVHEFVLPAR